MPSAGSLWVAVLPETAGFAPGLKSAFGGLKSQLGGLGAILGVTLGAAMVKSSISAFDDLEKATKRLQIGFNDIQQPQAMDDMTAWASDFADKTGILQADVEDFSGKLLNMGAGFFRNEGPKALTLLEDMTSAMEGMSVETGKSATMLMRSLGPAILNVPEKAVPLLQKYGALTDAQSARVLKLAQAGHKQAASEMILLDLTKRYGDAAAKAATPEAKFAEAMNKLQLVIGEFATKALPLLLPVLKFAAENIDKLAVAFVALKVAARAAPSVNLVAGSLKTLGVQAVITAGALIDLALAQKLVGAISDTQHADDSRHAADLRTWADNAVLAVINTGRLSKAVTDYIHSRGAQWKTDQAASALQATLDRQVQLGRISWTEYAGAVKAAGLAMDVSKPSAEATALARLAAAHRAAAAAAKEEWLAELQLAGGLLGVESAAISASQAHDTLKGAQAKVNHLVAAGKKDTAAYRQALADETQAALDATTSQLGLVQSVQDYIAQSKNSKQATAGAIGLIRQYGRANGLTKGEVDSLIASVKTQLGLYSKEPGAITTQFHSPGLDAEIAAAREYNAQLNAMHDVNVTVHTHYVADGPGTHGGIAQ